MVQVTTPLPIYRSLLADHHISSHPATLTMANYDPMGTTRRKRGCCYCCCGTKKHIVSWLLAMAILVAGIVLVCYFFIPRNPTFCFVVGYPSAFSASTSGVSISIPVNVSVDNPNYYGFSLDKTTVNLVYYDTLTSEDVTMSTVRAPEIHIRARGNSTTSFTVTMDGSSGTTESDTLIVKDCTPSGTTTLYINAAVTLLKWIHITVPNQAIKIQCSTLSALSGTVGLVNSTQSQSSSYYCKKT